MIFKWKDSFCTGIEEIDAQHKRLFEIGSDLYDIAILDNGFDHYDELVQILNSLKDYTKYHFEYEEKLMKQYEFQLLEQHKIEHDKFIGKLVEVESGNIDEKQKRTILDMIDFVANWISNHILKSDFKYKSYFNEKGIV